MGLTREMVVRIDGVLAAAQAEKRMGDPRRDAD